MDWRRRADTVAAVLERAAVEGFTVVGLRTVCTAAVHVGQLPVVGANRGATANLKWDAGFVSMLAVALRGVDGVARWRAVVGPEDPELARITDPGSLRATLGGAARADNALTASASPDAAAREVALLFGGRVGPQTDGCIAGAQSGVQPFAALPASSSSAVASPSAFGSVAGRPPPLPLVIPAPMERVWAALVPGIDDSRLCRALALLGAKGLALGHLARADLSASQGARACTVFCH